MSDTTQLDKRSAILDATLHLVSEHGFHGTPMSEIARHAGVGAGTIYRYFDSKEDLINALFLDLKRELSQAMLRGIRDDLPLEDIFRRLWTNLMDYCMQKPDVTLFLEQYHNSPFLTPETETETAAYLAPLFRYFEQAMESGLIRQMPFELVNALTYNLTVSLVKYHLAGTLELTDEVKELALTAVWAALRAG